MSIDQQDVDRRLRGTIVSQARQQLENSHTDPFVIACSLSLDGADPITDARTDGDHTYSIEPHIRVLVLHHLRAEDNWSALHRFLSDDDHATTIGYDPEKFSDSNNAPSRTAITRVWHDHLDNDVKAAIETAADEILTIARERGTPLDSDILDVDAKENSSTRTKQRTKKEATTDAARKIRDWFYPEIDIGLPDGANFANADLLDLLVHMCREQDFANNGADTWSLSSESGRSTPSGDTLRDYIREFDELDNNEVTDLFEKSQETLWTVAAQHGLLDGIVDVAIDEHNWRHYSDLDTPRTMQVRHDDGTNRAYQFLTISIVGETGERFIVDWEQVASKQEKIEATKSLVTEAQERVTVRDVLMDRGFSKVLYIQALQETGANFVIRARKNHKTKSMWEDADGGVNIEHDVTMSRGRSPYESVTVTRVVTPAKEGTTDEFFTYITNRTLTEKSARRLAEVYERRWGIETSFRVTLDFLPKTASMDFALRIFYFSFATLFYNMWVLVNMLVRDALGISIGKSPPVTAKLLLAHIHRVWADPPP